MAPRSSTSWADGVAIVILVAVAAVTAFTFRDYGLGWDDYTQSQYGELLLKLYGSGFTDQRALSFVNLYKYGGGFDMAAALAAKVSPVGLFETRRLIGAIVGLMGLFITWRLGRRLAGPIAGLGALALLAACPLYYGHMFMNSKDAPFAVAMVTLLFGIVWAVDGYPRPDARSVALSGVGLGAALGTRILAVVAAPYIAFVLLLIVIAEAGKLGFKLALTRMGQFLGTMLPGFILAYLITGLLWPWSIISPLNPLNVIFYFDRFFEKPWKELYEGTLFWVPDMPWTYVPHLFFLKLPIVMLVFSLIGTAIVLAQSLRRTPVRARAGLLVIALAPFVPIAIAMMTRPALYNGVRHFIFLVPPFAVLGGLGLAWLVHAWGRFSAATILILFAVGIALPTASMVRLHPYQYVYFNELAGGVRGAQANYMLDYWGLAFKQAAAGLREELQSSHALPPANGKWVVAVCGPQPAAEVALGPEFETTWKEKTADFVMSLGVFYCRDLNAPVLAEVKRDGVIFARVYDVRGQSVPDLLTESSP